MILKEFIAACLLLIIGLIILYGVFLCGKLSERIKQHNIKNKDKEAK